MKIFVLLVIFLMSGCGNIVQPEYITYFERSEENINVLVKIGIGIAKQNKMEYRLADIELYENDFEYILEATENDWFYRSFGIGWPKGSSFAIALKPNQIYTTLTNPSGDEALEALRFVWANELSKNGLEANFVKW